MQITTVHYERRRSDQAYGNRMVALTAALEDGDEPGRVLGVLRDIAHQQLDADARSEEEARRSKAAADEERYRREHEEYRARATAEREATARHERDLAGGSEPYDDEDDEDDEEDA